MVRSEAFVEHRRRGESRVQFRVVRIELLPSTPLSSFDEVDEC